MNRALTAGFTSAFEVVGFIAIAGFAAALAAVRHLPVLDVAHVEVDAAA